jgi:hypothetical protein
LTPTLSTLPNRRMPLLTSMTNCKTYTNLLIRFRYINRIQFCTHEFV